MNEKQMAIVGNVRWDPNDERAPGLMLEVKYAEASAANLCIPPEEVFDFFSAYGLVTQEGLRFADLEKKPVWVTLDGRGIQLKGPCVL